MVPSDEFLRHATECQHMAKFSRDPTNKQIWSRMAERWIRCAELARPLDPQQTSARKRPRRQSASDSHSSL
jgi:hypothetical protein